jgi:hypothetical protein
MKGLDAYFDRLEDEYTRDEPEEDDRDDPPEPYEPTDEDYEKAENAYEKMLAKRGEGG